MNLTKLNFSYVIFSLIPLSFVIGPLFVEIIINLLIILFLFDVSKKQKFDFLKNNFFYIFGFLFINNFC